MMNPFPQDSSPGRRPPPVNQLANRTANDDTPSSWFWLDLRQGPLVMEVPPKVLGLINDIWVHWSGDGHEDRRRQERQAAPATQ